MGQHRQLHADPAEIHRLATALSSHAKELRTVQQDIGKLPQSADEMFRGGDAAEAFTAFVGAWSDELSLAAHSLDELGSSFNRSARVFARADRHSAHSLTA